ncbi:TPA: hypothetical protein DCX15_02010, partial [bacterium]|nr:hypothetical protein [bacterium]
IISSHCHVIVNLIERHYPELLSKLVPVVSPMIALGRFIRTYRHKKIKIVYIGPCIAKKDEIKDETLRGIIDEVLIFGELKELLNESYETLSFKESGFDGYISSVGRLLPMAGGLSKNIGVVSDISRTDIFITGGRERCLEVLEGLKNSVSFKFFDILFCQAGCPIDGPGMESSLNLLGRREAVINFANVEDVLGAKKTEFDSIDLSRGFLDRSAELPVPTREQIRKILNQTNKSKPEDELNCGACGYATCREKAIAVVQGLAEIEMCLPYLLERIASSKEKEIEAIIESMNDGLVVIDKDMRVTLFNQAASRITGMSKNQAIGRFCWEVFHTEMCRTKTCPYKAISEREEEFSNYESTILTMDGLKLPIRSSLALLRDEKSEVVGAVKVFCDVSKQKEIEEMKSEFISHVSHELRTPLASIKGSAELLLYGIEGVPTPEQKNFLDIIKNNVDRLIRLISDLLDLSKIESGRLQLQMMLTDLGGLIEEVVSNIKILAEDKGLKIEVLSCKDLPKVPLDPEKIKQVLTNLLSNAIKYSSSGVIRIWTVDSDQDIQINVQDNGIGIDPKDFKRIFEKFQPIDSSQPKGVSVGLGLCICKGIIEAHQGRIWVESELGKGSTFSFALPKEKRKDEKEPSLKAYETELSKRPVGRYRALKKILVVDDDPEILNVFGACLEGEGYEVSYAHDGDEALAKAKEIRPDAITLDILMPKMSGFDVLERLRSYEETKDIPIIIVSIVRDQNRKELFRLGITDYFYKPFSPEFLVERLKKMEGQISSLREGKRILIVEDDLDIVKVLKNTLVQSGYHPIEAYSGEEAIILANRNNPDLILLDLGLPGMDGLEVIRKLKKDNATSSIPIIVLTVRDIEGDRIEALGLGVVAYMTKPFSTKSLVEEICKTLTDIRRVGKNRVRSIRRVF